MTPLLPLFDSESRSLCKIARTFHSEYIQFPAQRIRRSKERRWQPVKSVGSTVMVLYKTEGSFCLLVHDDIATFSAWHAKGSGSLALEGRLPGLQIRGRKLQSAL